MEIGRATPRRTPEQYAFEQDFRIKLSDALSLAWQLKQGIGSSEDWHRLEDAAASLCSHTLYDNLSFLMRVTVPPEINAHTSHNYVIDEAVPPSFTARVVREISSEAVKFSEFKEKDGGKWLVVYDNFDKLIVELVPEVET